jgi:uncharacterized protein (TIGR03437 family)
MCARTLCYFLFPFVAAGQAVSFLPAHTVQKVTAATVSGCSACVAVADFNGDGKADIAFNIPAEAPAGGVLLGNGDGTFQPGLWFSPQFGNLLVGDFNGDRKPDLMILQDHPLIYSGKGDGTFGSPVEVSACQAGTNQVPIQIGDFNRDGNTDILCGTSALLSNADGTFRAAGVAGNQAMEVAVLVADFNNDGAPDVLLRQISGNIVLALSRGDGTFGNEQMIYAVRPQTAVTFLAADFNGDGNPDLIDFPPEFHPYLDFLPGKGDGTFGDVVRTDLGTMPAAGNMTAVGDFNKDGKLDFVAGDAVYAGNGDGTFRFPVFFGPTSFACGAALNIGGILNRGDCSYSHGSTTVSDFNGDGLPDLVAFVVDEIGIGQLKENGEINLLLNDSPGNGLSTAGVVAATGTWPVAPGSIVSAYGTNLAPGTAAANTGLLPTTLGGIRVHVRDRSHTGDTLAPLLYVSASQINYILNSSDPYAWVDIERVGSTYVPQGMTVPVATLAPGFFTVAAGIPAASAVRVAADGMQTPLTVLSAMLGAIRVAPIDVTAGTVYLTLYGTGFAQASTSASTCSVGNVSVPVSYAGPQIEFPGLDQVNVLLPGSLAGAGLQPVSCLFQTADQIYGPSNAVNINIR